MTETTSVLSPSAIWVRLGLARHNWPGRFTVLLVSILLLLVSQPMFSGHAFAQNIATATISLVLLAALYAFRSTRIYFVDRVDPARPFDRMPLDAVIHVEPNGRNGRRDFVVPVSGRDRVRAGIEAVHREERYARHYQRGDLRLPADGRRVCIWLRSGRTARSRFVQRRAFSEAGRPHRASDRVASQLHLLQLRVPDDDRVSAISRQSRKAPAASR